MGKEPRGADPKAVANGNGEAYEPADLRVRVAPVKAGKRRERNGGVR